jgi:hypothetical protein
MVRNPTIGVLSILGAALAPRALRFLLPFPSRKWRRLSLRPAQGFFQFLLKPFDFGQRLVKLLAQGLVFSDQVFNGPYPVGILWLHPRLR